jgi:lysophospholipase L1-like esterase
MHPGQPARQGALAAWLAAAALVGGCALNPGGSADSRQHWVASWGSAQAVPWNEYVLADGDLSDTSLRQIVNVSLDAKRLRVRVSNVQGTAPLEIAAASVALAVRPGTPDVQAGSVKRLTFDGQPGVTIPASAEYYSDPVDLEHAAASNLAITLHFPKAPARQTAHPGSRTTSFFVKGNRVAEPSWADSTRRVGWWQLADVEVLAPRSVGVLVAIGDSITDGHGATTDLNDRWPNALVQRLHREGFGPMAVVNTGIGGNRLLRDGLGPNVVSRFDRDVIMRPGVTHAIVLIGINDLGNHHRNRAAEDTPQARERLLEDLKTAFRQIAERAHTAGVCIIGGTLTPYIGSDYYKPTADNDTVRLRLNEWIRTSGTFDAIADFDAAIRDPADPGRMRKEYSYDWLHPGPAGFRAMADAVPLDALRKSCRIARE